MVNGEMAESFARQVMLFALQDAAKPVRVFLSSSGGEVDAGMGQIAAFGDFSARRQRILFGLQPETGQCDGRLTFYTQKVIAAERPVIYRRVDEWLDPLEQELRQALTEKKCDYELLCLLAGRPLL